MEAVQRGIAQGRRRAGVVLAGLLFALLASGSVGYLIRYATAPTPTAAARTVTHPVTHAVTQETNPNRDRWWEDPPFARSAAPAAAPATPHHSDRVRTY